MRLRLAVARFGEMDSAKWWNTQGLLGSRGATVMRRGFPRTHHFVQARVVFAVARARCEEVFHAPESVTLWTLTPELEDQAETLWQQWLDDADDWSPFFDSISDAPNTNLAEYLSALGLVGQDACERAGSLSRSHDDRAVALGTVAGVNDDIIADLALGFCRSEPARLAVPFASIEAAV